MNHRIHTQITAARITAAWTAAVLALLTLILASCDLGGPGSQEIAAIEKSYRGRAVKNFYAYDEVKGQYYQIEAVHLAENDACIIWGERSSWISLDRALTIADTYEKKIHGPITEAFGDYLDMDGNKKLTILLLDIKDSYKNPSDPFTVGYFSHVDLLNPADYPSDPQIRYSNKADMIYMDTSPGIPDTLSGYKTIAHELQHLINFSIRLGKKPPNDPSWNPFAHVQEVWVDEGLSSAAEYIYTQGHVLEKLSFYNNAARFYYTPGNPEASDSHIARGNNFFIWTQDKFIYDEYVTVYLFFQWLRVHSTDDVGIYRDIINSDYTGLQAVTEAAAKHIDGRFADWGTLLETWLLANYVNADEGFLGYKKDLPFALVTATPDESWNDSWVSLLPGEGIFSALDGTGFTLPAADPLYPNPNISYTGVTKAGDITDITVDPRYIGANRLLTFNRNAKRPLIGEFGAVSGLVEAARSAAPSLQTAPSRRTDDSKPPLGPRPVDPRPPLPTWGQP